MNVAANPLIFEIGRLRAQLDTAHEEIRQLKDALRPAFLPPREWGLTTHEAGLLGILRARKNGATKEQILFALYGHERDVTDKILDVFLCKLRKKLRGTGVEITSLWGQGLCLTPEGRAALERHLAGEPSPSPQPEPVKRKRVAREPVAPAVSALTDAERRLVRAYRAAGWEWAEIEDAMKRPVSELREAA